jgi:hypothetical protein
VLMTKEIFRNKSAVCALYTGFSVNLSYVENVTYL